MTIYKPKKLKEAEKLKSVSLEIDKQETLLKREYDLERIQVVIRRRRLCFGICTIFLLLTLLFLFCLGVGLVLYRRLAEEKPWCGTYEVKYHDSLRGKILKTFKEKVEIDKNHERIDVPQIMDYMSATVLHDFEQNYTAIVDREKSRCYVLPLNRTLIRPPRSVIDMIEKLQNGYYMPDVEILKENYYVELNPFVKARDFGMYIGKECAYYDIYRLYKIVEEKSGVLMKRAAPNCIMEGEKFCLGSTFNNYLPCLSLAKCT